MMKNLFVMILLLVSTSTFAQINQDECRNAIDDLVESSMELQKELSKLEESSDEDLQFQKKWYEMKLIDVDIRKVNVQQACMLVNGSKR